MLTSQQREQMLLERREARGILNALSRVEMSEELRQAFRIAINQHIDGLDRQLIEPPNMRNVNNFRFIR